MVTEKQNNPKIMCFYLYQAISIYNQLYVFFQVIFLNAHNYQQHVYMKKVKLLV